MSAEKGECVKRGWKEKGDPELRDKQVSYRHPENFDLQSPLLTSLNFSKICKKFNIQLLSAFTHEGKHMLNLRWRIWDASLKHHKPSEAILTVKIKVN